MQEITITIDGNVLKAKQGETIIQVANRYGIYIPRYCYHPALSIAGNCRMCLVEIEKNPKLQIACATLVSDGMIIYTQSEKVKKARKDILEFLLLNHPLDCPICDQVGECYLQDYYMDYGLKKSRINYDDKIKRQKRRDLGKLILDNERCILCTRCVRFLEEVTKTNELFINSRGDRSYIDIKPATTIENNYALNLADICPVGALTSKDFRFKKRVYLLKSKDSICTSCATGCKIKVQFDEKENKIYRILPSPNIYTNTWICDVGRFSYKLVHESKISNKLNSNEINHKDLVKKYSKFLSEIIEQKKKVCIIISNYLSLEDNYALYMLGNKLFETNNVYYLKTGERKIKDGILFNTDETPNSFGVEEFSKKYNLKAFEKNKYDLYIGFEKEIEKLSVKPENSIVFSYNDKDIYPNIISIKSYFENQGSFINWQGYLRETQKIVEPTSEKIDLYDFIKKLLETMAVYIKDKQEITQILKENLNYKKEE